MSEPRFFEQSEDDYAKKCMAWLIEKGYVNISFTDPRLSYFDAQIDADLLPHQFDGGTMRVPSDEPLYKTIRWGTGAGLLVCRECGAVVFPEPDDEIIDRHEAWHARIAGE